VGEKKENGADLSDPINDMNLETYLASSNKFVQKFPQTFIQNSISSNHQNYSYILHVITLKKSIFNALPFHSTAFFHPHSNKKKNVQSQFFLVEIAIERSPNSNFNLITNCELKQSDAHVYRKKRKKQIITHGFAATERENQSEPSISTATDSQN
jgi:hypothetical protein